jgi:hypothetical protein
VVLMLLTAHSALLVYSSIVHSPVNGEPPAIAAGVYTWTEGRFTLFRVNPPLSRMLATIPVIGMGPETDWRTVVDEVGGRPEFAAGEEFVRINGRRFLGFLRSARWACIPISVLGGWLCWRWASLLYSRSAGCLALGLWCFSPNVLTHGSLATADMSGAVFGLLACYLFWRWLCRRGWRDAVLAGFGLGLGLLGKTTNFYLVPYLGCLGAMAVCRGRRTEAKSTRVLLCQSVSIFFVAWMVLHLGYGLQHALVPLKTFRFASQLMAGAEAGSGTGVKGGNRFAHAWLGELPSPVPADYLIGIDLQARDFELQDPSYLRGRWRSPGWWWYYLYAGLIKLPVGTLLLLGWALAATAWGPNRATSWKNEMFLILPAIAVLVVVSSQTGMNRHFRYVLPALPFLFIWLSKTANMAPSKTRTNKGMVACALCAFAILESLWAYPHSLSFFNVFVGSRQGGEHLGDSNIDWGQDQLFLARWLADHPRCRPCYVVDAAFYPWESLGLGVGVPSVIRLRAGREWEEMPPSPGWYAISVSRLYDRSGRCAHFLRMPPAALVGYSIRIYQVGPEEANAMRQELGLPEFPEASERAATRRHGGVP